MQIRDILKSKKEDTVTFKRNEVVGKKKFNGNFISTKVKRIKKEEQEV